MAILSWGSGRDDILKKISDWVNNLHHQTIRIIEIKGFQNQGTTQTQWIPLRGSTQIKITVEKVSPLPLKEEKSTITFEISGTNDSDELTRYFIGSHQLNLSQEHGVLVIDFAHGSRYQNEEGHEILAAKVLIITNSPDQLSDDDIRALVSKIQD
ncbi:hypothetical protein IQ276_003200 [Desmonostoc muscorum LEGE 12446]|uniref:Uncharacterized protein n=1 Tax=Desmonostoc muscorum LEGE 12446 TaxID=1828758 RepID=A0A8J6ZKI9_DESMC|nr:hypothetical protein [Desmonostoc muscorum]MCF2145475.1 hypothetical protein [Desmonostoc muscorum LEGE 12446]